MDPADPADPADPSISSPSKRKRSLQLAAAKTSLSLLITESPSGVISEEDDKCESPRTKVAYHFQKLELEGPPISKLDLQSSPQVEVTVANNNSTRKRMKYVDDEDIEIPETPQGGKAPSDDIEEVSVRWFDGSLQVHEGAGPVIFKGLGAHSKGSAVKLSRSYPSINRLADSKSRGRKRISTPPLGSSTADAATFNDDPEDIFVDHDRAALTWHDDEITGRDPSDPEDDGEGINGVGFKPTPAEARARMERRRQQMAEYKSREMKEARAKRSERRRGGTGMAPVSKEVAARKVHFSETEANIMITT